MLALSPPLRRTLKVLGWILGSTAALLLLIFVGSYIANSFDEELTPEAKALLTPPPNPYATDDNLFVAFAGFNAPPGVSMMAKGAGTIDHYNQLLPPTLTAPNAALPALPQEDPSALNFKGDLKCCPAVASSIWHEVRTQREHIEALNRDNQELMQRYRNLLKLSGYYDTARPSFFEPFFSIPQPEHSLWLANVALRIQSSDKSQQLAALDDLAQDELMWKRVFQGDGTLLSMLVAATRWDADFLLLTDMLADPTFDPTLIDEAHASMVTPLALSEWKIGKTLSTEIRAQHTLFMAVVTGAPVQNGNALSFSWWQRQAQYFKINATENLEAKQLTALAQFADGDPSTFSLRKESYQRWVKDNVAFPSMTALYNPMGKTLVQIASGPYYDYPARVYDIAATQRLACLVYEIRRQNIPSAEIPGFLKQHPELSTHPVDAKPFEWNPTTQELRIPVTGPHAEGQRFSVKLYPTPN